MSIKKHAAAVACGLALATTALAPVAAFAGGNTGSTDVTVQVEKDAADGTDQLAFEVPTVIPFAAKANGELVGPSTDSTKIVNKSVFPIHVTGMSTSAEGTGWNLVADASNSASENSLSFELNGVSAAKSADLSKDANWNMSYAGSAADSVAITSTGKVSHVTKDLSSAQKAATVTWTLAAGAAK
ncbi:MAG: hypothetical protein SOY95_08100 [Atopobiaceae bacterium]|nr:hypothetical protein [Atopobiaceae bacterium]